MSKNLTQGGHHLNSAIHRFSEVETVAMVCALQIETLRHEHPMTHKKAESVTSDSHFFNRKSVKIAIGEIDSLVPGWSERE